MIPPHGGIFRNRSCYGLIGLAGLYSFRIKESYAEVSAGRKDFDRLNSLIFFTELLINRGFVKRLEFHFKSSYINGLSYLDVKLIASDGNYCQVSKGHSGRQRF
jgi:hypothetical protein